MPRRAKGSVYRPTVTTRRNGRKVRRKAKFYWAHYIDGSGQELCHVVRLANGGRITDKDVARSVLDGILNRVERKAAGLIDPMIESASMPMRVVLARYLRHLRGRGVSRKHFDRVHGCVKWTIEHAGVERLADFNADRLDKAFSILARMGRSPATLNVYRKCAFSLAEWAVKVARILDRNPVEAIGRRDERADIRKVRRSLTVDEAYRLLNVAGPRRLFYAVQLWTGLRVGEAAALEWRDLDLDGDRPAIRLRAATTKAKRADVLPVHADLVELLRAAKPTFAQPTDRVFSSTPTLGTLRGKWFGKGEERRHVRGDLDRAGIPFADDQSRTIDRHALRMSFISWLGASGVDPRAQIALARHAPTGVTLKHYQDFGLFDLWGEIRKLPPIRWTDSEVEFVRATGTDDAVAGAPHELNNGVARPVAQNVGRKGGKRSATDRIPDESVTACHVETTLQNKGFSADPDDGRCATRTRSLRLVRAAL